MSKRWTEEDDRFIFAYYDAVGAYIGPHDLGRTEKATTDRYLHLKKTGAWQALDDSEFHYRRYRKLAGFKSFKGLEND